MMSNSSSETLWQKFHVGQRVWCKNDDLNLFPRLDGGLYDRNLDGLCVGEIYTIRDLLYDLDFGVPTVRLEEIQRPLRGTEKNERGFSLTRFEPVREQNIEIFRQMCRDVKDKVSV